MLDINDIKNNVEKLKKTVRGRGLDDTIVDNVIEKHNAYLEIDKKWQEKRNLRNKISVSLSPSPSPSPSSAPDDDRKVQLKEAAEVKNDLKELNKERLNSKAKYEKAWRLIPNFYAEDVSVGTEDKIISEFGTPKKFDFEVKDHVELGKLLNIIDIETAGKVSGSRFYYLKNEAVLLEYAIIQYVLDVLMNKKVFVEISEKVEGASVKPFSPVLPPMFVKEEVMKKMDRFDHDCYYYEKDKISLVGSAEHTLGPMHMDEILDIRDLPVRYIGFSSSFRREAGSYGKEVRGIMRTHHFDKLEMESFSTAEQGQSEQNFIVALQEYLIKGLELPYRVVIICSSDMGKPDYRQVDIETWMPSQSKYIETHTSDYMTDYQSRRLNTRYKGVNGETKHVYMNDATAFAIGRTLVALLENHQQKDGSVAIPDALQPYTKFKKIEPKKSK